MCDDDNDVWKSHRFLTCSLFNVIYRPGLRAK